MEKESELIKKRLVRLIGFGYFLLGAIIIFISFRGMTGFVVLEEIPESAGYVLGIISFVVGILVLMSSEDLDKKINRLKKEVDERLRAGGTGTARECIHYAQKLGYEIREGPSHTDVYRGGIKITEVPRHVGDLRIGTYRSILKSLKQKA